MFSILEFKKNFRVGKDADEKFHGKSYGSIPNGETKEGQLEGANLRPKVRNSGLKLQLQHFRAMMAKRFHHLKRSYWMLLVQLVIPIFFMVTGLSIVKSLPTARTADPLVLTLDDYDQNQVYGFLPYLNSGSGSVSGSDLDSVLREKFFSILSSKSNFERDSEKDPMAVNEFLLKKMNETLKTFNNQNIVSAFFGNLTDSLINLTSIFPSEFKINDTLLNYTGIYNLTAFFNDEAYHSPAISLNLMDNAIFRTLTNLNKKINTTNHPLPPSDVDKLRDWFSSGFIIIKLSLSLLNTHFTKHFQAFINENFKPKTKTLNLKTN